jgi:hypothetical protein
VLANALADSGGRIDELGANFGVRRTFVSTSTTTSANDVVTLKP